MLQLREEEIFKTLKNIKKFNFVIIGGYAVNAYTLPRFSVDCDIVITEKNKAFHKSLKEQGYKVTEADKINTPYKGEFMRYEKKIQKGFKVSTDILIREVLDRQTNTTFTADWISENSSVKTLKGKTITEKLKLNIINIDALIVMKSISCRNTDIRDVFMLMPKAKDKEWIKKEISSRHNFENRMSIIKKKVLSKKFKDNLQGVYGYIEPTVFEKHKKAILYLGKSD
ncbi:MAG: nucleotidyl transferase AbiEii/AbiGii toxin family protein [Nanoarchaeota archaeon]|nr:nucleotidyl transferase AbiEii/AbiGii toxin family protein [DPANN group archaeon]MBL7116864.1 nucleotidyl transferase AbiEii/AbiGii toxin family protein [Nanoarchaeota archaeon]